MHRQYTIQPSRKDEFVDIHGNNLNAMFANDGSIFIPLTEIQRTGFHIYHKADFNRLMFCRIKVLSEFQLFMLGAAKQYMMQNGISIFNEKDVLDTIDSCRKHLLKYDMEDKDLPSSSLLGRSLLSDPAEVDREVKAAIYQNILLRSSDTISNCSDNSNMSRNRNLGGHRNLVGEPSHRNNLQGTDPSTRSKQKQASSIHGSDSSHTGTSDKSQKYSRNGKQNSTQNDKNGSNTKSSNRNQPQNRNVQANNDHQQNNRASSNSGSSVTLRKEPNTKTDKGEKDFIKLCSCNVDRIQLQKSLQEVLVVHIQMTNEKEKYWVQLVENEKIILDILQKCIECSAAAQVLTPKLGEIYMAMSAEDELWYRAVVLRTRPSIKVNFIDFGNESIVQEVRKIPDELRSIPAQAVRITLSRNEGESVPAKLKINEVVSIRHIKQYEDGTVCVSTDVGTGVPDRPKEKVNGMPQSKLEAECQKPLFMDKIKFSTALKDQDTVKIIAYSDGKLYLRNKEHHVIFNNNEKHIKELPKVPIGNVKIRQIVLCEKKGEKELCRAIVIKKDDDLVTVEFIDFKQIDTVSIKDLYGVNKSIVGLPVALIESPIIKGYDANLFKEEAESLIEQMIESKSKFTVISTEAEFDLSIGGKCLSDMLFPTDKRLFQTDLKLRKGVENSTAHNSGPEKPTEMISVKSKPTAQTGTIEKSFVKEGRADTQTEKAQKPILERTESQKQPENTREETADMQATKILYDDMSVHIPSVGKANYVLTTFKDRTDFMVIPTGEKESELVGRCTCIDVVDDELYTPMDSEMVLARFEGDWYRGVVVESVEEGKFHILFVDYGNTATLTKEDIRRIPQELTKIPLMGILCSMNLPDTEAVKKRLTELLEPEKIYEINVISYDLENLTAIVEIPEIKDKLTKETLI